MAAEPNHQYRPAYWMYAVLAIAAIVLLFMGGRYAINQYQASTGIILTGDDVSSVQDLKPSDYHNGQVTLHLTLTSSGADKFANAKPNASVYFKNHEIGTTGNVDGNAVTLLAPIEDAAKTKLQLAWKGN